MKNKIAKGLRKKHQQVKKKSKFLLRHPLIIPTATFMILFFAGLMFFVVLGASTQGASDARIVNVFVDGEQQTVTTRAVTVEDLLNRLDVELSDEDIVEPSRDAPILEDNTQVNIYRARPVKVIDGDRVLTLLTAQQAPRLVAYDAGLDIFPEDEISFERLEANVLETSVSEQLSVVRSVEVQLNLYGVVKKFRTTAKTVEDLLIKEGVAPEENETVQPAANSEIKSEMLISVNRPGVKTLAISEKIPYNSDRVNDDSLQAGKTQVKQTGVEGEKVVIYEIEEEDGVETSRKQIQIVVVREPVDEIIARGTKIVAPSFNPSVTVSGDKAALMAAAGIAESDFGYVDFIISHESGWRPGAVNAGGCIGLGQNCPSGGRLWLVEACPNWGNDPVCQLRRFSVYANRYGGWAGAYEAWQVQRWW